MADAEWTPARLKALRRRLGWTQRAAAARLGVSRVTWTRWEGGGQRVSRLAAKHLDRLGRTARSGQENA